MNKTSPPGPGLRIRVRARELSNDDLVSELQSVANRLGKSSLSKEDFDRNRERGSSSSVVKRFGGWREGLEAAGLDYEGPHVTPRMREQPGHGATREEIVAELQRVAKVTGKYPSQTDFESYAAFSTAVVRSEFGSWQKAAAAAGFAMPREAARFSDEDCFENLLQVWSRLGAQPRCSDMRSQTSTIGPKAYLGRFGTWNGALLAFKKFVAREQPTPVTENVPITKRKPRVARSSEASSSIPLRVRYRVLVRDRFRCVLCGANPSTVATCLLHVDHIVPVSRGGLTVVENLRCLCSVCNLGKSNLQIEAP